jgi:hypothetical protein
MGNLGDILQGGLGNETGPSVCGLIVRSREGDA